MAAPKNIGVLALFLMMAMAITVAAARPISLSLLHQPGLEKKGYEVLGVVCKCCDGLGGECRDQWEGGSCTKLQCLPWKFH